MPGPVIIGFEDSDGGRDALALGAQLARAEGSKPLVSWVLSLPEAILSDSELEEATRSVSTHALDQSVERLEDLDPDAVVVSGTSAPRALHNLGEDRGASAIVVGPSHKGRIGRLVAGSTATGLLHSSPCAVAVAAGGHAEVARPPIDIAVACDGSSESQIALQRAIGLAETWKAKLTVIGVSAAATMAYSSASVAAGVPSDLQQRQDEMVGRIIDHALERIPDHIRSEGRLIHGLAGEVLAEVSEGFELMVVGSRGYGALRSTVIGSSSRRLVSDAGCSILVVPRGG